MGVEVPKSDLHAGRPKDLRDGMRRLLHHHLCALGNAVAAYGRTRPQQKDRRGERGEDHHFLSPFGLGRDRGPYPRPSRPAFRTSPCSWTSTTSPSASISVTTSR